MAGETLEREEHNTIEGKTFLFVGAWKMSDLAAVAIAQEGARVLIATRAASRAHIVAERAGGTAVAMADLQIALVDADLVLASTGASQPLITRDMVAAAMEGRVRPLVILDLAVPRDVEPAAAE